MRVGVTLTLTLTLARPRRAHALRDGALARAALAAPLSRAAPPRTLAHSPLPLAHQLLASEYLRALPSGLGAHPGALSRQAARLARGPRASSPRPRLDGGRGRGEGREVGRWGFGWNRFTLAQSTCLACRFPGLFLPTVRSFHLIRSRRKRTSPSASQHNPASARGLGAQ